MGNWLAHQHVGAIATRMNRIAILLITTSLSTAALACIAGADSSEVDSTQREDELAKAPDARIWAVRGKSLYELDTSTKGARLVGGLPCIPPPQGLEAPHKVKSLA